MLNNNQINEINDYYKKNTLIDTYKYLLDNYDYLDRVQFLNSISYKSNNVLNNFEQYKEFVNIIFKNNNYSLQKLNNILTDELNISEELKNQLLLSVINEYDYLYKDNLLNIIKTNDSNSFNYLDGDNLIIYNALKNDLYDFEKLTENQKLSLIKAVLTDNTNKQITQNIYLYINSLDDIIDVNFKNGIETDEQLIKLNELLSNIKNGKDDRLFNNELDLLINKVLDLYKNIADVENINLLNTQLHEKLQKYGSCMSVRDEIYNYIGFISDTDIKKEYMAVLNDFDSFINYFKNELKVNDKIVEGQLINTNNGLSINNTDLDSLINTDYKIRFANFNELDYKSINAQALISELNIVLHQNFGPDHVNKILDNDHKMNFKTRKGTYDYLYKKLINTPDMAKNLDNIKDFTNNLTQIGDVVLYDNLISNIKENMFGLHKESNDKFEVNDIKNAVINSDFNEIPDVLDQNIDKNNDYYYKSITF